MQCTLTKSRCIVAKMIKRIALIAIVTLAITAVSVNAVAEKKFVEMRCDGTLTFFEGFPFGPFHFKSNAYKKYMELSFAALRDKVKCSCPTLTDAEIEERWFIYSPYFLMQLVQGPEFQLPDISGKCTLDAFFNATKDSELKINMPSTCSYSAMRNSNTPCRFGFTMPQTSAHLAVEMKRCSNRAPYVAAYCSGDSCNDFFSPCQTDAHCRGDLECLPMVKMDQPNIDYFNAMKEMGIFAFEEADEHLAGNCLSMKEMMRNAMEFLRAENDRVGGLGKQKYGFVDDTLGVCVPSTLTKYKAASIAGGGEPLTVPDGVDVLKEVLGFTGVSTQHNDPVTGYTWYDEVSVDPAGSLDSTTASGFPDGNDHEGLTVRNVKGVPSNSDDIVNIFHFQCDANLAVLPKSPWLGFEIAAYGLSKIAHWFRGVHFGMQKCRAAGRGLAMTADQYDASFFTLLNLLRGFTLPEWPSGPKPMPKTFKTFQIDGDVTTSKFRFPSGSCSYETFVTKGICKFETNVFSRPEIFDDQFKLQLYVGVCPGAFTPEVLLQCKDGQGSAASPDGKKNQACQMLLRPYMCADDSECTKAKNLKCWKKADLDDSYNSVERKRDSGAVERVALAEPVDVQRKRQGATTEAPVETSVSETTEPETTAETTKAADITTAAVATNPTDIMIEIESSSSLFVSLLAPFAFESECSAENNGVEKPIDSIFRMLHMLADQTYEKDNGICFVDFNKPSTSQPEKTALEVWAEDLATVENGNEITLPAVEAWEASTAAAVEAVDGGDSLKARPDFNDVKVTDGVFGNFGKPTVSDASTMAASVFIAVLVVVALLF